VHTVRDKGVSVELGAEGFVARSSLVPRLCRDVGIEDELIDQATTVTYTLEGGALRELAPGEAAAALGFQVPKDDLGRGIRSLRTGMGRLVEGLQAAIGDRIEWRTGAEAAAIEPDGGAAKVRLGSGERIEARAVVLTTPAPRAAALCAAVAPGAAAALEGRTLLSNASVTLLYSSSQIARPLRGSGFIVPAAAQREGFRACSFVSTKFARDLPHDAVLLRAFFRPTDDDLAACDPAAWIDRSVRSVAPVLGVAGAPLGAWASVWPHALPVYDEAYRSAVASAERALSGLPVLVAGSHYHGAGIDAAIGSAERAAEACRAFG
jgi:oxygen-dependent protoporphyrinogen oxidase